MSLFDRFHLYVLSAALYLRIAKLTAYERMEVLVHHGLCPRCRDKLIFSERGILIDGPRGGLAQNVYCPDCQHGWNYTPGTPPGALPVEALGLIDPKLIATYQNRMAFPDEPMD